ncbi:hypothetical protein ACWDAO_02315 [Streptomyces sp. NPDC001212]|uniref:hypothetical protein n=1 Tax=Streptomyces sp. NPDC001312 TaxID=3364561 RepID=UPI0036C0DB5C
MRLSAVEKELLEYLLRAGSEAGPVHAELAAEVDEERAELTVCLHEGRLCAVYESSLHTVSESIRKLRRGRLVLLGGAGEGR